MYEGRMPRYSTTGMAHMVAPALAVHRPSMSLILRPASATAARAERASSSMSVKPGASPQPKVATPAMTARPRSGSVVRMVATRDTALGAAAGRAAGAATTASIASKITSPCPSVSCTRAFTRWPIFTSSGFRPSTRLMSRTPSSSSMTETL